MKSGRMTQAAGAALVVLLAAAGFVAWSWPLVQTISSDTLVRPADPLESDFVRAGGTDWNLILANDQTLSLWGAIENVRSILAGDLGRIVRPGQCWPMPASIALGEHMIELGVLAAPWWIATGNPVTSYNLVFATGIAIGALGMFLFLYRHTSSLGASVVGAMAFAFATPRLIDLPYHPAVTGTHWIPWVLWSFDRALARGGPGSLVLLAVTLLLSGLVGAYPLVAVAIVGGTYGTAAVVRAWRRGELDRATLAWCAAAVLPSVFVVGALVGVYSGTQHEWMLQPNPGAKFVVAPRDYLTGGSMSVGIASLLGLVLLVALRGAAGALAVPGLAIGVLFGLAVATAIPTGAGESWSVFGSLASRVPLFDSVRGAGMGGAIAVYFGVQALGAFGWARLFAQLGGSARWAVAGLLLVTIALEARPPEALRGVLGKGAAMQLRTVALDPRRVEVFETALAGDSRPVLDLPLGRMVRAPLQLLDAAYHGHETSACYNSLVPATLRAAYALASHSSRGVAELSAAGFGYVIERKVSPTRPLLPDSFPPPARLLAFEEDFSIWELPPPGAVHHDVSKLAFEVKGGATRNALFAPDPPFELDVDVTNRGDTMWALAHPPVPLVGDVELAGNTTLKTRARGVLPLALQAGETVTIQLVLFDEPPPGAYRATVTLDGIGEIPAAPDFTWSDH
jgi:hypothetical protein